MDTILAPGGLRIACPRRGSGPDLVLVHGTTGTHARWAPVLEPLAAHFTVHAMDRRGRGESGDAPEHSLLAEARDVAALVDSLEGPVDLLGHSFGAICALEAALLTSRLRRLVLYEPPIPSPGEMAFAPETLQRLQALLEAGDREALLTVFFREVNGMSPQAFEQMRASPMWQARLAVAHTLPRELRAVQGYRDDPTRLAGLRVPVLLLLGGDSPPYFAKAIQRLEAALPWSRTRVMAGQQHIAMDTAPQLFVDEVLAFLREPGTPPAR